MKLVEFAELLEATGAPGASDFYWTAVEADKGDKEAIRQLLVGFAVDAHDALKWRGFKDAVESGEFAPDARSKAYRKAVEDVNVLLDNHIS